MGNIVRINKVRKPQRAGLDFYRAYHSGGDPPSRPRRFWHERIFRSSYALTPAASRHQDREAAARLRDLARQTFEERGLGDVKVRQLQDRFGTPPFDLQRLFGRTPLGRIVVDLAGG